MLYKLLQRFVFIKNNKFLGRWNINETEKQKNFKITWANYDHCGDIICKDPKKVKEIINKRNI